MNIKKKISGLGLTAVMFLSVTASAHVMWVNAGDFTPKAGKQLLFSIGWGHDFFNAAQSILVKGRNLKEIYLLTPEGEKKSIESINDFQYKTSDKLEDGNHIAVVIRKEGFVTKTKSGKKFKSKEDLDDVIESRYVVMSGKAIINAGKSKSSKGLSQKVGLPLELVPLNNPAKLRKGKYFKFKLLCNGKPVSEKFQTTYQGFSQDRDWAAKGKTDRKGVGRIKISHSGLWLIKVHHKEKYPDQKISDIYSLTTSLTFEVK